MSRILNNKYIMPIVLVVLGFITRFAFIWHPSQVVFDEVHTGKMASAYLTGNYIFDIHPPLGKLLISLSTYIFGFQPGLDFEVIGGQYTDASYIALRLIPNLFGALLPLCIFFFVRSLNGSKIAAFFAGITIVFENAILVHSHFILLDSMLLFFGFFGLTLFFWYRNYSNKLLLLFAAGIFLACSASVKWTGLSFLGLAWFVSCWDIVKKFISGASPIKDIMFRGVMLVLLPFCVYMSIFAVHFSLLNKSGPGDAFMSPGFLKTLEGSSVESDESIKPINYSRKFIELNKTMYSANAHLTATHPNSSNFYTWPVMARAIYYWFEEKSPDDISRIYLLGNPFIWWVAFLSMIFGIVFWRASPPETKVFLYTGWLFNFIPFINIKRVMFLYHYFPALIISIVIMSFLLFDSFDRIKRYRTIVAVVLISIFILGFIFFSPLTYGFSLNSEQYNLRLWLKGWY